MVYPISVHMSSQRYPEELRTEAVRRSELRHHQPRWVSYPAPRHWEDGVNLNPHRINVLTR